MNLTAEYLKENEDCVYRNFRQIDGDRKSKRVQDRHRVIRDFIKGAQTILSVGCGAYEPVDFKCTHAIDIVKNSETYLRSFGWKGEFKIGSCDKIPYPSHEFEPEFDVAICQEVIEHLPELETVKETFEELNRVAERWIVTTPVQKGSEPTHKRVFTFDLLIQMTEGLKCRIEKRGGYWYVFHDEN